MGIKINKCQYNECGLEYIPAKYGFSKYCSSLCRSRASQQRQGKSAKDVKCQACGSPFKRRSAKNTKCLDCRDKIAFGEKLSLKHVEFPQLDEVDSIRMQEAWLKTNTPCVSW